MKVNYFVEILDPKTHIVKVKMTVQRSGKDQMSFYLPSWSPGSYLMREYSRNIRTFKALSENGEYIYFEQAEKGTWIVDFNKIALKKDCQTVQVEYEIFCHELTVRTSHVDESHAFLHGPSYLMGLVGEEFETEIEFKFTPLWSKLSISLDDISEQRERFIYKAASYDVLIDAPVEIGCHETDGFMHDGKEHHLVWYGEQYPHSNDLKADIKVIVETVAKHFSDIPYTQYMFMTHFKRGLYGGLEHLNSTALQFDGRKLGSRKDYVNWLALVAHEYFHTWNVKRIRPIELGPFDYRAENYTSMHWLTEGLTSFMDEIFVLRSGLCTLEEYLDMQKNNLQRYFSIPGKKFHSLEASSFNAWIKLYRPDENSNNSSISYYLKGGLVFSTLHFELQKVGKSINDLLNALWARYNANPAKGMVKEEVLDMIESIGNKDIRDQFELRISTTEDIDFETYYKQNGMEFEWEESDKPYLGIDFKYSADRAIAAKVVLDSPAYAAGINAEDEILAINNVRILKNDIAEFGKMLVPGQKYQVSFSRLGVIKETELICGKMPRTLKSIKVLDEKLASKLFLN